MNFINNLTSLDMNKYLYEQWASLSWPIDYWSVLDQHYTQSHRAYHNWDHIQQLLQLADQYLYLGVDSLKLKTAIFYHDVIYVVGSQDNEFQSAQLMKQHLRSVSDNPEYIEQISDMIVATKNHISTDRDTQLLLALDLAGLASDWNQYETNSRLVRQEFISVPDEIFYPHRKQFLLSFMERDKIFLLPEFESWNVLAHTNLKREYDILTQRGY